jgi:hypothetical protein
MLRTVAVALLLGGVTFIQPAKADPPSDGKPLSEILQALEQTDDFSHVGEIEWDEEGYWEIEYYKTTGRLRNRVKVNVDPLTGEVYPVKRWR